MAIVSLSEWLPALYLVLSMLQGPGSKRQASCLTEHCTMHTKDYCVMTHVTWLNSLGLGTQSGTDSKTWNSYIDFDGKLNFLLSIFIF